MLPDVGSTIVPPGRSFPSRSAASIIASPIRSFTEPPGFRYSSFASSSPGTLRLRRSSRTIGVEPTSSRTVGYSRLPTTREDYFGPGPCIPRAPEALRQVLLGRGVRSPRGAAMLSELEELEQEEKCSRGDRASASQAHARPTRPCPGLGLGPHIARLPDVGSHRPSFRLLVRCTRRAGDLKPAASF